MRNHALLAGDRQDARALVTHSPTRPELPVQYRSISAPSRQRILSAARLSGPAGAAVDSAGHRMSAIRSTTRFLDGPA